MLRYVIQYKFSILLAILIFLLSLAPASDFPVESFFYIPYIDKIVHMTMYASFGFVALMESRCTNQCLGSNLLILFIILLVSALIEVLQATVVASRGAEWYDLLANFLGLAVAYVAYRLFREWKIFRWLRA